MIALGAVADVIGAEGSRELAIADLYGKDGVSHIQLEPDEVVLRVRVPIPGKDTRVTYRKWAVRQSVDFPLVSVALRLDCIPGDPTTLAGGAVVVGALGPRPKLLDLAAKKGAPKLQPRNG